MQLGRPQEGARMSVISRFSVVLMIAVAGLSYVMYPSDKAAPSSATDAQLALKGNAEPSFDLPIASQYAPAEPARAHVFEADINGNLILDRNTTVKMDVLLAELPSPASARDLQRIDDIARTGLADGASRKALRVLHDYIAYRKAEVELSLQPVGADAAGVQERLNRLIALRRAQFGEQVASALFSEQELQARFSIDTTRIEADASLSPREKAARIALLKKALPAGLAGDETDAADAQAALASVEQVAALRQRGAPETEVQNVRQRQLGVEGAQQVSDMETQKLQWERRFQAFSQQKNAMLSATMSEPQKQEKVEALLRQHYTDQEIDTARAYDLGNSRR